MAANNDNESRKEQSWPKRQRPWRRRDGLFRITVRRFCKLDGLGFFDDRKVELIRGVIFEIKQDPRHSVGRMLANDVFRDVRFDGLHVRHLNPLDTGRRSLLLPDLCVVPGAIRDYSKAHPTTAALVVEVSEGTLKKDRTIKAHLYAQAGIPDYWIVNLVDRQLEVHRNPGSDPSRPGRFRYAEVTIVPESGRMAPLAAPRSEIAVADLLP